MNMRLRSILCHLLWLALTPLVAQAAESNPVEMHVKAAFLAKFPAYVEWPSEAFESPSSPVNLCVVGEDPFRDLLDRAAQGQRVGTHPLQVKRLKTWIPASGCHLAFFRQADMPGLSQIFDAIRDQSVLTVTDEAGPDTQMGMIHFVIQDNRVRFDVDDQAAAQSGLTISSKLLNLALNVKTRQPKEKR